jgi:hypothetical protein
MFLRKQALLVFKGSPNPCFVIKTSFLLAKGSKTKRFLRKPDIQCFPRKPDIQLAYKKTEFFY